MHTQFDSIAGVSATDTVHKMKYTKTTTVDELRKKASESAYKCINNIHTDHYCLFMKYFERVHEDYVYDDDDNDDDDNDEDKKRWSRRATYQSAAEFISLCSKPYIILFKIECVSVYRSVEMAPDQKANWWPVAGVTAP